MGPYYVFHYFNSRKATIPIFSGECLNKEADQSSYERDFFQEPEMLVPWNLIWGKALSLVPLVSTSETFCFLTSISALEKIPRWIWAFTETRMECAVVVFSSDGATVCINGCLNEEPQSLKLNLWVCSVKESLSIYGSIICCLSWIAVLY